jgi:hypothetical protein
MTAKRNLKRRVRERQARTGESYVAARRQVLAGRVAAPDAMKVVELHDVSAEANRLGFCCRILAFPSLIQGVTPAAAVIGLRDALIGSPGDPATARLFSAAFGIASVIRAGRARAILDPRWVLQLARAGVAGYASGALVTFPVVGHDGSAPMACALWDDGRPIVLTLAADLGPLPPEAAAPSVFARLLSVPAALPLFVIHDGRRYLVTTDEFVIGRNRRSCDLALRDGLVSRQHAVVIWRGGAYYLADRGSTHGVHYKGMRIDHKRIEEGDVFQLGAHELRFTFIADP